MSEFKKNPIATDEDYFKLSDNVYNNDFYMKRQKSKDLMVKNGKL